MVPGMAADGVSGAYDRPGNVGPLLHESANQKKGRLNLMTLQDFEQAKGPRIIGPVVCEGKLADPGSKPMKVRP